MREWWAQWLMENAPPLILALMGGIADYLMSDDHSVQNMFIGVFLAGFCGYMVLLLCNEWGVSEGWMGISCGVAGLSSRAILNLFKRVGLKKIAWMLQSPDDPNSKDGDSK